MNLIVDLDNPGDRARALALLSSYGAGGQPPTTAPAPAPAPVGDHLLAICRELLDPDVYGPTRLGAVRLIAAAAPGKASRQAVYAHFAAVRPDGQPGRMMGALHGNLESSWRRLQGPGRFFRTTGSGFEMDPEVAAAVLRVLDEAAA